MIFPVKQFGLIFRLVEEKDAAFILSLRTDPKLSRYLNSTADSLKQQQGWIRNYKKREKRGEEYYFLFADEREMPLGVIRLYNILGKTYTGGSWLVSPGADEFAAISSDLFLLIFGFEVLGMEQCLIDTRKSNKKVVRYHRMFSRQTGEDEDNFYFEMDKADYCRKREFLTKIINDK